MSGLLTYVKSPISNPQTPFKNNTSGLENKRCIGNFPENKKKWSRLAPFFIEIVNFLLIFCKFVKFLLNICKKIVNFKANGVPPFDASFYFHPEAPLRNNTSALVKPKARPVFPEKRGAVKLPLGAVARPNERVEGVGRIDSRARNRLFNGRWVGGTTSPQFYASPPQSHATPLRQPHTLSLSPNLKPAPGPPHRGATGNFCKIYFAKILQ